jgi:hypothetical protein
VGKRETTGVHQNIANTVQGTLTKNKLRTSIIKRTALKISCFTTKSLHVSWDILPRNLLSVVLVAVLTKRQAAHHSEENYRNTVMTDK